MNIDTTTNGLNSEQVEASRTQHGNNSFEIKEDRVLLEVLKEVVLEPMFILLMAACVVYFLVGEYKEDPHFFH